MLAYNKKRQAAITAEICEIAAAAMAIEANSKKGEAGPGLGVVDNEESVEADFMRELDTGDVADEPVPYDTEGPDAREGIKTMYTLGPWDWV